MTKQEKIDAIAKKKAETFLKGPPKDTGLLKFLLEGFTGLNSIGDDMIDEIYEQHFPPVGLNKQPEENVKAEPTVIQELTPRDFIAKIPAHSVLVQKGFEIVGHNIMIILARTGNKFRDLSWDEYVIQRKKEGNFKDAEKEYFIEVSGYCKSAESAFLFSREWASLKTT